MVFVPCIRIMLLLVTGCFSWSHEFFPWSQDFFLGHRIFSYGHRIYFGVKKICHRCQDFFLVRTKPVTGDRNVFIRKTDSHFTVMRFRFSDQKSGFRLLFFTERPRATRRLPSAFRFRKCICQQKMHVSLFYQKYTFQGNHAKCQHNCCPTKLIIFN